MELPTAGQRPIKHDVFISFRGEDTRHNFVSHLYAALKRDSINTYVDELSLRRGDQIISAVHQAIEKSMVSVVIFSKYYASSTWCLDELVKIMECHEKMGQIVMPVFYHVAPSDVRKQKGSFEEAFDVHEQRFKGDRTKVLRWRNALTQASNLSGWDSRVARFEALLVDELVSRISEIVNQRKYSMIGHHNLVGIEQRTKEFESLLSFEISDVRSIGICGMGGIGKTTLAKTVFDHYRSKFECSFFLENMRDKKYTLSHSHVLKQFLSQVSAEERGTVDDWPSLCKSKLRIKRTLIVLDDVYELRELKSFFAGDDFLCGKGSRIIITTRDRSMLLKYGVDMIYEVGGLNSHEALKLFSLNAFKQHPPPDDYLKLSRKVVEFAKGVPLALKVLGSFLYGKNKQEWEFRLQKLKSIPNQEILNKLKVSFDALDEEEKNIFLDVACFFRGEKINRVKRMLEGSYFSADIGISLLTDKCLLYISNNKLEMHDLLQSMGREIVRQESKEPSKRSRLWNHEDVYYVLMKDKGSEAIEGISLDLSRIKDLHLSPKTFSKMTNLRFLKFFFPLHEKASKVHLPLGLDSFPNKLRYIHWHGYPLMSLPSKICLENLVELNLPYSQVRWLWKGTQILPSLRLIDLRYSRQLIETPQLSATNLECLILEGCDRLSDASLPFHFMSKLKLLNVKRCTRLKSIPGVVDMKDHQIFNSFGRLKFPKFPEILSNLKELYMSGTELQELPQSIVNLSGLAALNLENCQQLRSLPSSICKLKSLEVLVLSGCSRFEKFPEIFETMNSLSRLNLDGTAIREMPSSIDNLVGLSFLNLRMCGHLISLPDSMGNMISLEHLILSGCSKLEWLPDEIWKLESLKELELDAVDVNQLSGSILALQNVDIMRSSGNFKTHIILPRVLGHLMSLQYLYLSGNSFEKLPASIGLLPKLQRLDVSYCRRLRSLPELPRSLAYLDAHDCWLLEDVPGSTTSFTERSFNFIFSNCFQLDMGADDSILLEAHLGVEEMAITSPKLQKVFPSRTSASICIPGDQIPDWFTYQSMGSSISVKVPIRRHSYKRLGYALCTVISFDGYHDDGQFNVRCRLKTDNGDFNDFIGYSGGWFSGEGKSRFISSDHMFLWLGWFTQELPNVLSFEFYPVKNREHCLHKCKVIKCGVHLLYSEVEGETGFPKPACSAPFNNLGSSVSECNFREVDKGQGPDSKRCRRDYLYDEAQPSGFIPCEGEIDPGTKTRE
ncbi:hypothetical protein K2173_009948 [Erythroxylum novogranatense]|uniref:ADP-ribosyl cyclase/cyclic ADP-ribose hydrolase n=1 Tax=Erythroxylum novogranatense TaxID=1862640 RepID=A0AAV8SZE4_9ROSI|nr:hypothetical protein K2173_009948 [Erythroxylum novogranatense]